MSTSKPAQAAPAIDSSETTVNQEVVTFNTQIIIIEAQKAVAAKPHKRHAAPGNPIAKGKATPDLILPEVSFAADGDRLITYHDTKDGSIAQFREDRQNNDAVSLKLHDAAITLTTYGSHRGYQSKEVDRNGHVRNEATLLDGHWGGSRANGPDRIDCPAGQRDVNITASVTDQVTRDQLQQFASRHPHLTETLKTVKLPATTAGGIQVDFKEALARPSNFEGCPAASSDAIRRK